MINSYMSTTHYILYKTINLINNKIYIGIHQTENINDRYLGSGKLLLKAIKKYGKENFIRETIATVSNEGDLERLEIEIVTEEFCSRKDVYNIMPGGRWGSKGRNGLSFLGKTHKKESIDAMIKNRNYNITEETKEKMRNNSFSRNDPERQKECTSKAGKIGGSKLKSDEHKAKIAESIRQMHERKKLRGEIEVARDTSL